MNIYVHDSITNHKKMVNFISINWKRWHTELVARQFALNSIELQMERLLENICIQRKTSYELCSTRPQSRNAKQIALMFSTLLFVLGLF